MAADAALAPRQLIFATKVNRTPVMNQNGDHIGHIEDLAIEKRTGQVAYAVLSCGGFLGLGERLHPLPWSLLTYDPTVNAYIVPLNKDQLHAAPAYSKDELADIGDSDERYREHVYDYYRAFEPGVY
ncbi:MAG: PRC-barrel domain-containing protein [Caulobacteraceae bacterium]|nr:PRC-barrel domain-containing protein [Caulobacteraceae bacterium]